MTKREFLKKLRSLLHEMDRKEREKTIKFYDEMISESMDDGISEQDAVANLGNVYKIAGDILAENLGSGKQASRKSSPGLKVLNILLLIIGFPLWFPVMLLVIAVFLGCLLILCVPLLLLLALLVIVFTGGLFTSFAVGSVLIVWILKLGAGLILIGLFILTLPLYKFLFTKLWNLVVGVYRWIGRLLYKLLW